MRFVLSPNRRRWLIAAALAGFAGPNGLFVYSAIFHPDALAEALRNPAAMAFISEAFFVVAILAALIARMDTGTWGWKTFVLLSLIGGLGFSIPLFIVISGKREVS